MNKKRLLASIVFCVFLFLVNIGSAIACEWASQYRLFPLGTVFDEVIALELEQFRNSDPSFKEVFWKVQPTLVAIAPDGTRTVIKSYAEHKKVIDKNYKTSLETLFKNAHKDALALAGFRKIKLLEDVDCQYLNTCKDHSFEVVDLEMILTICEYLGICAKNMSDDLAPPASLNATISDQGKKSLFSLRLPPTFIKHESADGSKMNEFPWNWHLKFVRIYSDGSHRFALINIVSGSEVFDPCKFAPKASGCTNTRKPRFRAVNSNIKSSFFHEPALHHGHNFEVIVRLPIGTP